jgi:GR25 family glycosyltransferase involved in LPS biosynthesis
LDAKVAAKRGLGSMSGPGDSRAFQQGILAQRHAVEPHAVRSDHPAPGSTPMYRGVFLNLDRSEDRRATMQRQFEEIGAANRYERFPAVEGRAIAGDYITKLDAGALGLWVTHERLMEAYKDSEKHLHIVEDDVVFAKDAVQVIDTALRYLDAKVVKWDILYTDIFIPITVEVYKLLSKKVQAFRNSKCHEVIDLEPINFASASSLIINKNSLGKYADLIKGKWNLGYAIDIQIRKLVHQKLMKAYLITPFMTTIAASAQSDIRGTTNRSRRVYDVFRRSFFQDADLASLHREMDELLQGAMVSSLTALFMKAETFTLSDKWSHF